LEVVEYMMIEDVFSLRGAVALVDWDGEKTSRSRSSFYRTNGALVLAVASKFPNGSCGSAPTVNMTNLCE
jgi:hypothetical protein